MIRFRSFIFLIFLSVFAKGNEEHTSKKLIFCSFVTSRPKQLPFEIESLDPTLCTHIIYYNAEIDVQNHDIRSRFEYYDHYDDEGLGLYNRTMKLKEKNPELKVILRMTGFFNSFWEQYEMSPEMVTSKFAKNAVGYMQRYGFDGLDIGAFQRLNTTTFFSAIRQEFDKHGYILVMFIPPFEVLPLNPDIFTSGMTEPYHFLHIGLHLNIKINSTAVLSPLPELKKHVSMFLEKGIPPEKLIVSIPAFAVSYKLRNINDTGISAEIDGAGDEGESVSGEMFILYYELMQKLRNASEGWVLTRDNSTGMMYGHSKSLLWLSYEDTVSVEAKAQYIIQKNLGGSVVMTIDMDDFIGYNEDGVKFPLTRAVYNALRGAQERQFLHPSLATD